MSNLAIAYNLKKRRMAHGGRCAAHGMEVCGECHGGKMAEGGFVEEEEASGYQPSHEGAEETEHAHPVENQEEDLTALDMIERIMRQRSSEAKGYSEGGEAANDTTRENPDLEDNQFDDLVKDDDMEFNYTGKNSGDELGDEGEDDRRQDIVHRIMQSRKLRDRNPRPA